VRDTEFVFFINVQSIYTVSKVIPCWGHIRKCILTYYLLTPKEMLIMAMKQKSVSLKRLFSESKNEMVIGFNKYILNQKFIHSLA